jgi:hypothetical protein
VSFVTVEEGEMGYWTYALLECHCGLGMHGKGKGPKKRGPELTSCPKKKDKRIPGEECMHLGETAKKRGHMCKAFCWANVTEEFEETGSRQHLWAQQQAQDYTHKMAEDLLIAKGFLKGRLKKKGKTPPKDMFRVLDPDDCVWG